MSYYILQSLALLALAYVLGCCLGCFTRRLRGADELVPAGTSHATAAPAPTPPSPTPRTGPIVVRTSEPSHRSGSETDVVVRARPATGGAQASPSAEAGRFKRAFEPQAVPVMPPRQPAPAPANPLPAALAAAAAAATAVATQPAAPVRAPVRPATPAPTPIPVSTSVPVAVPVATGPAEDLKRIKGVGPELERRLNALGVRRYQQIAAWTAADVAKFSRDLDFHGRIQHENWIEQAQILAHGGETAFSRRVDAREVPASHGDTWTPVAPSQIERQGGVSTDEHGAEALVGSARRDAASAAAAAAAAAIAAGAAGTGKSQAIAGGRTVMAARTLDPMPVAMSAGGGGVAASGGIADDLKRIRGISAEVETALLRAGVTRYGQIAVWLPADVERLSDLLGLHGRIERESWIDQAHVLARGGETEFSRRMRQPRVDRNQPPQAVRPQLPTPPTTTATAVSANPSPRGGLADDLKRIRGINLVIEKKLARMNVVNYGQIAGWSASDIERISESLGVRGNIERERWIEQAQILSGGGHTDFSKRVDRGVVASSRDDETKS